VALLGDYKLDDDIKRPCDLVRDAFGFLASAAAFARGGEALTRFK